jgi:putative selenium metabolism protein SsnA
MDRQSIRNGVFVSLLPKLAVVRGDLVVEDGIIVAVGDGAASGIDDAVDVQGALVLPGLVNAHTHLYSALAVGMDGPAEAPTNFTETLERIWWRLDRALDEESLRYSALVGGLEAARSGVTVLMDHHASPSFIRGSLSVIADALDSVGVGAVLCYETTDRGGPQRREEGIAENEAFIHLAETQWAGRYRGLVGAHASFTLDDVTLGQLASLVHATGRGLHIHVAEDPVDFRHGAPIERLDGAGLLGPNTILGHGVHLGRESLRRVADCGAWLVHNPRSNMNNAVGYAKLAVDGFERLALGTDGIGSDVLTEARVAFFKAREEGLHKDCWTLPLRLLQGGLRMAEAQLGGLRGRFEVGAVGDVVQTDYVPATVLNTDNLVGHMLFGFDRSHIQTVWANGRVIWPTPLDVNDIATQATRAASGLWKRMEALDG